MQRTSPMLDVEAIRARARQHIESGAVTKSYGVDRQVVVDLLNASLATEIVCALRYKRHHFMAAGLHADAAAAEFLEHAKQELDHANSLASRIVQLGGEPNLSPVGLAERSHSHYVEGSNLLEMIRENLIAERIAIEAYTEIIRWIGDGDPTTRTLLERILAVEEEHAEDMSSLLQGMSSRDLESLAAAERRNGAVAR